ncbi:hypothetical protein [Bosea sp. NPDC055594]
MVLQGYESLARLVSLLSPAGYQNLLSRISDGKPRLYLSTYGKFGFRFRVDPHFIAGKYAKSRNNQRTQFTLKLSDIASSDISGLRSIEFNRQYTREDIHSTFPSLVDFFRIRYPNPQSIVIEKDHIYDLLLNYSEFNSHSFPVQVKKKEAQFLRATMPLPANRAKAGRRARVFDDRFYDLFLIAMQPSASSFGIESIARNISDWIEEDDLRNDPIKDLKKGEIIERVRRIYQECELKNAKMHRRK